MSVFESTIDLGPFQREHPIHRWQPLSEPIMSFSLRKPVTNLRAEPAGLDAQLSQQLLLTATLYHGVNSSEHPRKWWRRRRR